MEIEKLKDTIQDGNLNFLVGSGLSVPFFQTLSNIELLLSELSENKTLSKNEKIIIRASILAKYYENVIQKNPTIIDDANTDANKISVLTNYKKFLLTINSIILKRKSTILNKQVNLFTTNIDVFFEKALEETQLEFNDGFYGRLKPVFSLTNYKKSFFKKSLQYENSSEVPVFNLLKVHGSLTWKCETGKIFYSDFKEIKSIQKKMSAVKTRIIDFVPTDNIHHFIAEVRGKRMHSAYSEFIDAYECLAVVNPTKEKFHDTILNLQYYELLRIFSNELEKENSILFIMGFSMADEHIREIILRAANSNPTLTIKIFAYNSSSKSEIDENLKKGNVTIKYSNIDVIAPPDGELYDFKTINEDIFRPILLKID